MSPLWHDGPLADLARGDGAVAWSVSLDAGPGIKPHADDLADAARTGDGAARLARRLLARALVARRSGVVPETVMIGRDAFGAPRVVAPAGWYLGISGGGGRALIGVARVPIGVDREALGGDDVLWDMLTAKEAGSVRALPAADRPAAWLARWTIKEAHAKLVGEPRRIAAEAIETVVGDDGRAEATFEGRSTAFTRMAHGGIEAVAMWASAA